MVWVEPSALVTVSVPRNFGANRFFTPPTKVGEPADVRLELGVGVVDHGRIEADAGDDEEGVAVVVLRGGRAG